MAMTYTTLTGDKTVTGSIKSWQNYGKVDAVGVLEDAQAAIYRSLRVTEMRATADLSVVLDASSVALPTGFLNHLRLHDITNDLPLEYVSEDELENRRIYDADAVAQGRPYCYAIFGGAIQFDSRADEAFKARLTFYKRPALLAATTAETNFLTDRYPDLLRAMCLAYAAEFSHDSEMYDRNYRRAMQIMTEISVMDELTRNGQTNPVTM
jgi:hypothetical protein